MVPRGLHKVVYMGLDTICGSTKAGPVYRVVDRCYQRCVRWISNGWKHSCFRTVIPHL